MDAAKALALFGEFETETTFLPRRPPLGVRLNRTSRGEGDEPRRLQRSRR